MCLGCTVCTHVCGDVCMFVGIDVHMCMGCMYVYGMYVHLSVGVYSMCVCTWAKGNWERERKFVARKEIKSVKGRAQKITSA
jgi:hypothetical protein